MTAEAFHQLRMLRGQRLQDIFQVNIGYGTARSLSTVLRRRARTQSPGGFTVSFNLPARMPIMPWCQSGSYRHSPNGNSAWSSPVIARRWAPACFLHLSLNMLSLAVEFVQLQRQVNPIGKIVREQALYAQAHVGHTAGRIQPWPQRKPEVCGSHLFWLSAGDSDQGQHTLGTTARADASQPCPCPTRIRLLKSISTTSATVPSATRSSKGARFGASVPCCSNQFAFLRPARTASNT